MSYNTKTTTKTTFFEPSHICNESESEIDYKYGEGELLKEVKKYIDSTYSEHYAGDIQPGEFMMSLGIGTEYFTGNVIKYASRYGRKEGFNKKDMMKVIHYAIMTLHASNQDIQNFKEEKV